MMHYCLHPEHTEKGTPPWFLSPAPARFCPKHADQPKPRVRIVDGKMVPVEPVRSES